MSEKLLIVEDDKKLNEGIRLALKNDSYFFYQCRTLQEAREILKKEGNFRENRKMPGCRRGIPIRRNA